MSWDGLRDLRAVATARITEDGLLREANAGFFRLLGDQAAGASGTIVSRFFLQPGFASLAGMPADVSGVVYQGLLTIGEYGGRSRRLKGTVWRDGAELRLLAEVDADELELVADEALNLGRELAASQHALAQAHQELKRREAEVIEASLTDPLTGVGNRRKLEQALAVEISRVNRTGGRLSALMGDLDHFKGVNDRYGHPAGDRVLVRFAALLKGESRPTDLVARYGGEEFVILLPHADLDRAGAVAERARVRLEAERIPPLTQPVTASFGGAMLRPGEGADEFLGRADAALYRAKAAGRNRVVLDLGTGDGPVAD